MHNRFLATLLVMLGAVTASCAARAAVLELVPIPAAIEYSRKPGVATSPEYGAQLMNDVAGLSGCFGHAGVGGQWLVVCPKRALVVAWLSSDFNFTPEGGADASSILRKIYEAFPENALELPRLDRHTTVK